MNHDIKFFNYHEYRTENGMVTSFPNPYVPLGSDKYRNTRVIRIPRIYNQQDDEAGNIPVFSEYFPGFEPGAIHLSEEGADIPESSKSILENYMTQSELLEVVSTVNKKLHAAYTVNSFYSVVYNIASLLTFWMLEHLKDPPGTKELESVQTYIVDVNAKYADRNIEFVPPQRSGFLSLDIIITMGSTES